MKIPSVPELSPELSPNYPQVYSVASEPTRLSNQPEGVTVNFATKKLPIVLLIGALGASVHGQSDAVGNGMPAGSTRAHRDLTFKKVEMAEAFDSEATDAGFESFGARGAKVALTAFKASDGEGLTVEHGMFRSPDEANRFFHWMIEKRATDILDQGSKLDKAGRVIGLRAVVAIKLPVASSAILWTNNQHFFVIFSSSLPDVAELEKRYIP